MTTSGYRGLFRSISKIFASSEKLNETDDDEPDDKKKVNGKATLSAEPFQRRLRPLKHSHLYNRKHDPTIPRSRYSLSAIVSETTILQAQTIKEEEADDDDDDDDELKTGTTKKTSAKMAKTTSAAAEALNSLQRFKSASIGDLADLPGEDEKKSIAERVRGKLRGKVFKINIRSPKSEKKTRGGFFRRGDATNSFYMEDGLKPKYPIFGAPLEALELNNTTYPNVPRFVVDCAGYIEEPESIEQDGLYRASGNKVYVDELKQKLCDSYIYDPSMLQGHDIHTVTSLFKMFFRELESPLIPQDIYDRLGSANPNDPSEISEMREILDEMCEPNRSTLRFIIKHLKNVAGASAANRMPASNLAIVWGPCLLSANQIEFDIGRMNCLVRMFIENCDQIFRNENERLVA